MEPTFAHAANASAETTRARRTEISAAQRFTPNQPFSQGQVGGIQTTLSGPVRFGGAVFCPWPRALITRPWLG